MQDKTKQQNISRKYKQNVKGNGQKYLMKLVQQNKAGKTAAAFSPKHNAKCFHIYASVHKYRNL